MTALALRVTMQQGFGVGESETEDGLMRGELRLKIRRRSCSPGGEADAGGDGGGVFVVAIEMVEESGVEKRRRKEK
uniref:Uncharacterized protein n=1 Tax=Fagus sylvatica TaxID=28930 RepID=A0A2N9F989_FAGSY